MPRANETTVQCRPSRTIFALPIGTIQSATFGTSIADALRVYSADMRDKRIMRAEEKANMLPTKLTLGTMLFTVPPLLVILIGPSIYGMVTMLGQLASGL